MVCFRLPPRKAAALPVALLDLPILLLPIVIDAFLFFVLPTVGALLVLVALDDSLVHTDAPPPPEGEGGVIAPR